MMKLDWKPVRVDTRSADEEGRLVLANNRLVAVLVHLSTEHPQPELQDAWFLEAGFGLLSGKHPVFPSLEEAEAWVHQTLDAEEKRRLGLARASRSKEQPVPATGNLHS